MDLQFYFGDFSSILRAPRLAIKNGEFSGEEYPCRKIKDEEGTIYAFDVNGELNGTTLEVNFGFYKDYDGETDYDDGSDWGGYSSEFQIADILKVCKTQGNKLILTKPVRGSDGVSIEKGTFYF